MCVIEVNTWLVNKDDSAFIIMYAAHRLIEVNCQSVLKDAYSFQNYSSKKKRLKNVGNKSAINKHMANFRDTFSLFIEHLCKFMQVYRIV